MPPTILSLAGDWDMRRVPELDALLASALEPEVVVIDLSGAQFMDSTSLGAFVRLTKARDARGLRPPAFVVNDWLARVFDIVQFTTLFQIFRTQEEAIASFAQPDPLER